MATRVMALSVNIHVDRSVGTTGERGFFKRDQDPPHLVPPGMSGGCKLWRRAGGCAKSLGLKTVNIVRRHRGSTAAQLQLR